MKKLILASILSLSSCMAPFTPAHASDTFSMKCSAPPGDSMTIHFNESVMVADYVKYKRDLKVAGKDTEHYGYSRRTPTGKLIDFVIMTPATEDVYIVSVESKNETFDCTFK